ncbi:MAG: ComEA family DNA-binding protein [Lishizhenia sp.]
MNFNRWTERNLLFSRQSRKGVFAFMILFFVILGSQKLYNLYWRAEDLNVQMTDRQKEYVDAAATQNDKKIEYRTYKRKKRQYSIPKASFNPNLYTKSDWEKIGFSDKQAQAIMTYQEKGFTFRVKKDVQKLFVVSDDLYKKLYAKIDLPDSIVYVNPKNNTKQNSSHGKTELKLNLNLATALDLKKLYGVGDKLSERIVKYRKSLGGFVDLKQLEEIWGLSPETISAILPKLELGDTIMVNKMNINTATEEMFKSHPYLDWRIASQLVKFRANHGAFRNTKDILELVLIDKELFDKLAPYLTIE